jgi:hypothetical protein
MFIEVHTNVADPHVEYVPKHLSFEPEGRLVASPITQSARGAERAAAAAAGLTVASPPARCAALIATPDGRAVARGVLEFDAGTPRRARLRQIDRPGVVASLYFADGVRDVIVELDDGRRARARIGGTHFSDGERVCHLTGVEALA